VIFQAAGIKGAPKNSFADVVKSVKMSKPRVVVKSKMDSAKALGILGFTSTRWLDASSGLNPKQELDKAHFSQMMDITKKKRAERKVSKDSADSL
jgi:hypothetical protein